MARLEPTLHIRDLIDLRNGDPLGESDDRLTGPMGRRPSGHDYRLLMVADHTGHELNTRRGKVRVLELRFGLLGRRNRRGALGLDGRAGRLLSKTGTRDRELTDHDGDATQYSR